jgi:uncharacterized Ntn-hydrolase superfamily protein
VRAAALSTLAAACAVLASSCQTAARGGDGAAPAAAPTGAPATANAYCRRSGAYTETPGPSAAVSAGDSSSAALDGEPFRPVHTFSIVARDPATGDLGVAVQSHWFSVGAVVSWAEPGVGAVATQSFVDPAYGPRGLELMRSGKPAADALGQLLEGDEGRAVRQVAFVDAEGRVGAHTGERCIENAGHHTGAGYSVQANMMGNAEVVPSMARAYEGARGDLAERLMVTLEAAQKAGGDIRGCQSAALLVVRGKRSDKPWADKIFDLRVDDSPDPIGEMRRLVRLSRAYDHMNRGDVAVEKQDMKAALEHYGAAAEMTGGDSEMLYWQAVALAANGQVDRSIPIFRRVFADDPRWIELTRRLLKPGLLPDTPEGRAMVERIIREASPK